MRAWFTHGWRFRPRHHPPHTFGRLGAFIDGVYAITATLLVLDLRVPESVAPGALAGELAGLESEYLAYAFGFFLMAAGWLQTRRLESWMRGVDHYATLLFLASLAPFTMTPFTTAVLARALGDPTNLGTAVRLAAALLFIATVLFAGLLMYARRYGLFREELDDEEFTLYFRLGLFTWIVPLLAWPLSYVSPGAGLALLVSLVLLALLPAEAHAGLPTSRTPRPR